MHSVPSFPVRSLSLTGSLRESPGITQYTVHSTAGHITTLIIITNQASENNRDTARAATVKLSGIRVS